MSTNAPATEPVPANTETCPTNGGHGACEKFWLVEEELSPIDVGFKLNDIPMSAIEYGHPKRAFQQLAEDTTATADAEPTSPLSREEKSEVIAPTGKAIRVTLTAAQRKILAEILPEFADRLKLD